MIQIKIATAKVIPKKVQFIGTAEVRCSNSNPNQPVKGPGNTGKKEPIIPNNINKKPMNKRKISICECRSSFFYIKD